MFGVFIKDKTVYIREVEGAVHDRDFQATARAEQSLFVTWSDKLTTAQGVQQRLATARGFEAL